MSSTRKRTADLAAARADASAEQATAPGIYWLTEGFYPPLVGGQEMIAAYLAAGLAQRGFGVEVITRQTMPSSAARERIGQVTVRRINPPGVLKGQGWRAAWPLLRFLAHLSWILLWQARRYRIIIISGVKIMPLIAVPLARLLGKRCVLRAESYFELHEMISAESLNTMGSGRAGLPFRLLEWLRTRMLRRAAALVAISAQIRAELLTRGVAAERIHDIPNGVSLARFKPATMGERQALRERLGLPVERTVLLFSGRLSRAKGIPLLIDAWPALLARHPELYLVVVGSGNRSFDDCERQVKERVRDGELASSVRFFPETESVIDFLQAADLWVFPTEYEGFSLALAEALGCGLPVVATAVGAAPQLIQDGVSGFLCPPQDQSALSDAVERALGARERWPQIGAAARAAVRAYDLEGIAERYAALCRRLIEP